MGPTKKDKAQIRSAAVLRALKRYRALSDADVARITGLSRSGIQGYMAGDRHMTVGLMEVFAAALEVSPTVFFMEPEEALRWAFDNTPNGALTGHGQEGRSYRQQIPA